MSQRTPSKARISGQISGSGTIASETPLLKDEFAGRRHQIPFPTFCRAFLQCDRLATDTLDQPATILHGTHDFQNQLSTFTGAVVSSLTKVAPIYRALDVLMNSIVEFTQSNHAVLGAHPLRFTYETSTHPVSGSNSRRKPDLVGVSAMEFTGTHDWSQVSVACEYTMASPRLCSRESTPTHSAAHNGHTSAALRSLPGQTPQSSVFPLSLHMNESDIQMARYMLEMRSAQPFRAAGYGIQFMKDYASFWYSDADSTITSTAIPVDSPDFVRAIMHLARATPADIGYLPDFLDENNNTATTTVGARIILNGATYWIIGLLSLARAVHGRCTCVLWAKNAEGIEVAIKMSWQVITRPSEVAMIQRARSLGVESVVDIIDWIELRKLSEGRRANLQFKLQLEDRCLRVIILPLCMPLYKVVDPKDFLKACISLLTGESFQDQWLCIVFEHPNPAIHELYTQARILHRDVSVNNLMVKKDDPTVGVLIDLDFGHEIPQDGIHNSPSSMHRTGTLPFMALDLLRGQNSHYHRHDLESFVYVFFWIVGRYDDGAETDRERFQSWCEGNLTAIRSNKLAFLAFELNPRFKPTPSYDNPVINKLIYELRGTVGDAYANFAKRLARESFDAPSNHELYAHQRGTDLRDELVVYPEELPDLTYLAIRQLMEKALTALSSE